MKTLSSLTNPSLIPYEVSTTTLNLWSYYDVAKFDFDKKNVEYIEKPSVSTDLGHE